MKKWIVLLSLQEKKKQSHMVLYWRYVPEQEGVIQVEDVAQVVVTVASVPQGVNMYETIIVPVLGILLALTLGILAVKFLNRNPSPKQDR